MQGKKTSSRMMFSQSFYIDLLFPKVIIIRGARNVLLSKLKIVLALVMNFRD